MYVDLLAKMSFVSSSVLHETFPIVPESTLQQESFGVDYGTPPKSSQERHREEGEF